MRGKTFAILLFVYVLLLLPLTAYAETVSKQNVISNLCVARPWSIGIMATLLPQPFFDGLCSLWGYGPQGFSVADTTTFATTEVTRGISCPDYVKPNTIANIQWSCGGESTLSAVAGFTLRDKSLMSARVTPTKASEVFGIRCSDGFESLCTIRTIDPRVLIWADPTSVRLGARTNIFWSSQDVLSCAVTGPAFEEEGTSGGASTVSITKTATYTARCDTELGHPIEASVTVDFVR